MLSSIFGKSGGLSIFFFLMLLIFPTLKFETNSFVSKSIKALLKNIFVLLSPLKLLLFQILFQIGHQQ